MNASEAAASQGGDPMRLSRRDLEDIERLLSLLAGRREPGSDATAQDRSDLVERAKQLFTARRRRSQIFGKAMFGEPAWDMLLALYISGQNGSRQTIATLTQFSGAPATTALRWLDYLEKQQLIRRESNPTDRRAVFVEITDKGRDGLNSYLAELFAAEG